jgi:Protein of unknown function (DUF2785)
MSAGTFHRPYLSLVFLLLLQSLASDAQQLHDRAFWRGIAANGYAVPEHASADQLAMELSSLLASPDPELRDDLAYSILGRWIYRRDVLAQSTLLSLTDAWRTNLKDGIGDAGTNSVLKRSFSALCLASMARRDARTPFMGAERYHQLVVEAVAYLQSERDLRGYDTTLHWIHATAHTADLLAGLAGSTQLTLEEARQMLAGISARLSTAPEIFTQGEQDRLAAAIVVLLRRPDLDAQTFEQWLTHLHDEDQNVWTQTTPQALARYQNHTYLLQALFARLALENDSARIQEFRKSVLAMLKERLD